MTYKFNEPENTACFVCSHVLHHERPILQVTHDEEDGFWQFLCGRDDHNESNANIIALRQVVALDGSVNDLAEMPLGIGAGRETETSIWEYFKLE